MKNIIDYINEMKGDPIDDQWIQDEKPVITKNGKQVIITNVDYKEIPNIINGKVKLGEELFDYQWDENGTCVKALDQRGNPKQPDEGDNLVKAN